MHFKKNVVLFFALTLSLVIVDPVFAATNTEVINQYPQVNSVSNSSKYVQKIRTNINLLLQDGTHRPYPGGMYAEDVNKISFWKGAEVGIIAQTIPFLDASTQTNLKAFLKTEVTNYLVNQAYLGWVNGNSSQLSAKLPLPTDTIFLQKEGADYEFVYGLWAYAQYTGDWTTIQNNWSFISSIIPNSNDHNSKKFMGSTHYHRAPNSEIAGRIGYALMAKKLYQTTGTASYQTAYQNQVTILNNNFSTVLGPYISKDQYSSQVCSFDGVQLCTRGSNISERDAVPYLSQFDFLMPQVARYLQTNYLSQTSTVIRNIETQKPWWFMGSYNLYVEGAGEGYYQPDVLANQIYQAKALVLNDPVSDLTKKLPPASSFATLPHYWDALHYQNLLSLINRSETVTWVDSNTPPATVPFNSTITPTTTLPVTIAPSVTPTMCNRADIDQSGFVDLSDYSILVANFLKSTLTNPRADINQSGTVDLSDYSLLVSNFLKTCS